MLLIKEQGARVLTLIADDINTNGWLNVNKLNITDSFGQYKGVPYKSIMWKPTDTFDFNGYNHHHTILPYKNGNFAVGMESTTTECYLLVYYHICYQLKPMHMVILQ